MASKRKGTGARGGRAPVDDRTPIDWDDLDPGIRDVVRFLRDRGFDTCGSCEAGKGHIWDRPGVSVMPAPGEAYEACRARIVRALLRGGYRDFSSDIAMYHGSSDREGFGWPPQVTIEFWVDQPPIRPYAGHKRRAARAKPKPKPERKRTAADRRHAEKVIRKLAAMKGLGEDWVQRALKEL